MVSNSQIFTTTVFGNSSGVTQVDINTTNRKAIEEVYKQQGSQSLSSKKPVIPSNQHVAKGK